MTGQKVKGIIAFSVGVLFAVGLGLSGMTRPEKVIGFLDFFGNWDPTLVFVMGGAVMVYLSSYKLFGSQHPPNKGPIDRRLLAGAALFGAGWGLAGYCPGPALTSLGAGIDRAVIFVAAMLAGMLLFRVTLGRR